MNKKKLTFIGPVLPYRGGIAQHSTMLCRALDKISNLSIISFKRQYPQWLFPGESDTDPDYIGHVEKNTDYLIDSLNPFTWIKAVQRIRKGRYTTVVFPWWTVFWAPCFGFMAFMLRGDREVIFFCHNVVEHESAWWKTLLTKMVLRNGDRFVVHTREDEANLRRLFPTCQVSVHPHPIYDHFPAPTGTLPRRRSIELLFYGFVRPYKGLDDLIHAMAQLQGQDIQLTIAGEFWSGEQETRDLIKQLNLEQQIELRPCYHTDQQTAELFERADVVVLPYKSATGSGVVPVAYHYNTPVIVTRVGGLPDVVVEGETGWVIKSDNPVELSDVIRSITREQLKDMSDKVIEYKKMLSWDSLAKCMTD